MSGFPQITSELEWLPQLFVAGGLADLELAHSLETLWVGVMPQNAYIRHINVV